MRQLPRALALTAFTLTVLLGAGAVCQAQETHNRPTLATSAWLVSGAVDMQSTLAAFRSGPSRENNPLIRPLQDHPLEMVAAGAAMEVSAVLILRHALHNHPRVLTVSLWSLTALHTTAATLNYRWMR